MICSDIRRHSVALLFSIEAPYPSWSLPKLFGISGGLLLTIGAFYLAALKMKSNPALGAQNVFGGEMAFVLLLGFTALTGLLLFAATGTSLVSAPLAVHLGVVICLFLTTRYLKMARGFYRFAALVREAHISRAST